MLDGQIFQIRADGRVQEVDDDALTPFACVTFFKPEKQAVLTGDHDYKNFSVGWKDCCLRQICFTRCASTARFPI